MSDPAQPEKDSERVPPKVTDSMQRSSDGRFLPGSKGSPGRQKRKTERAYLAKMQSICTPDRWGKVVEQAMTDAENGDRYARDWLSKYLVPVPEPMPPEPEEAEGTGDIVKPKDS